jgi:hypothetical protein
MIKLAHPIIEDDERAAVIAALDSGQLAQGPRVAALEQAFAQYVGTKHAIAVANGTAALHLALLAHNIGSASPIQPPTSNDHSDEVIVPAFSFAATANTVLLVGARPVFVDVRNDDYNIDVSAIEAAITPRTRAIVAVHLYGQMCDLEAVAAICKRRNLVLIEDAAQAVGASIGATRAGATGTGCFSFYATKNLTTGEGGMITTNDDAVATRARILRSQGEPTRRSPLRSATRSSPSSTPATTSAAPTPPASTSCSRTTRTSSPRASCPAATTSGTSTPSASPRAATRAIASNHTSRNAASNPPPSTQRPSITNPSTSASATTTLNSPSPSGSRTKCCRCPYIQRCRLPTPKRLRRR